MKLKVGCCGFPKGRKQYYQHFNIVELQSTFYSLPELELVKKWRAEAPSDFEFTVKGSQLITHSPESPTYRRVKLEIGEKDRGKYGLFKPTPEVFNAWEQTRKICEVLKARIVVLQTPASFTPSEENLANMHSFFSSIEKGSLEIALELRGKWESSVIKQLCEKYDLIHCVDPFASQPIHLKQTLYFRLHGSPPGKKMYSYKYSENDLRLLQLKIKSYMDKEIYCMFNNIAMWDDALRFKEL
ncbi:MAG: DUF72 domain-containing protein [Methanocellales archaeon]